MLGTRILSVVWLETSGRARLRKLALAKAERVAADDRLVCFARYSDSLCRTFSDTFLLYGRCFALRSVLTARVIVRNCVRGERNRASTVWRKHYKVSARSFLWVSRLFRFLMLVLSQLNAHMKEGRLA